MLLSLSSPPPPPPPPLSLSLSLPPSPPIFFAKLKATKFFYRCVLRGACSCLNEAHAVKFFAVKHKVWRLLLATS